MSNTVNRIISWLNLPDDDEEDLDAWTKQLDEIRGLIEGLSPSSADPDDVVKHVRSYLESHSGMDGWPPHTSLVIQLLRKVAPDHAYLDRLLSELSESFTWDPDLENVTEIRRAADIILWASDRGKQHLAEQLGHIMFQILELLRSGSDGPVRLVIVLLKMGNYARPAIPTLYFLYDWSLARRDDILRDTVVEALIAIGPIHVSEVESTYEQMLGLRYRSGDFVDYLDCNEMGNWIPDVIRLAVDNGWFHEEAVEHDDELKRIQQVLQSEFETDFPAEFWQALEDIHELGFRARPIVPSLLNIAENWDTCCETTWPVALLRCIVAEAWDLELFLIRALMDPVTRIRLTAISGLEQHGWCETGTFQIMDAMFGGPYIKPKSPNEARDYHLGSIQHEYVEFDGDAAPFLRLHDDLMAKWMTKRQGNTGNSTPR